MRYTFCRCITFLSTSEVGKEVSVRSTGLLIQWCSNSAQTLKKQINLFKILSIVKSVLIIFWRTLSYILILVQWWSLMCICSRFNTRENLIEKKNNLPKRASLTQMKLAAVPWSSLFTVFYWNKSKHTRFQIPLLFLRRWAIVVVKSDPLTHYVTSINQRIHLLFL